MFATKSRVIQQETELYFKNTEHLLPLFDGHHKVPQLDMNGCGLWTQAVVNVQKDEPNERIMSFGYHEPYFKS